MRKLFAKMLSPEVKEDLSAMSGQASLTELDKIYLLLCEENLDTAFNDLCYRNNVRQLNDLNNITEGNMQQLKTPFLSLDAKKSLTKLAQKAKKANFEELAKKRIKKKYERILSESQVPLIPLEQVHIKRKLVSGPFSGVVCEAEWLKPDGTKEQVCLRYDNGERQRESFLREAKMSANLTHDNILKLHGVVLAGSYTTSVALVLEFAQHGNFVEALHHLSISSLVTEAVQLASALDYLQSKKLFHGSLIPQMIFMVDQDKFKIGGFYGCYREDELLKEGVPPSKRMLDRGFWFGNHVRSNFRTVENRRNNVRKYAVLKEIAHDARFRKLLPDYLAPLINELSSGKASLPFSEIHDRLRSAIPPKLRVTKDFQGESPGDLNCQKGDVIFLVSKTCKRQDGSVSTKWLGEKKTGELGFFDGGNTEELIHSSPDDLFHASLEDGKTDNQADVPAEIRARGPEAELAFQRALRKGRVRVYRGRVMLIGQDRAGKTSLKKSLLSLPFDPMEQSTDGVEVDPSVFEVEVDRVTNWQRVEPRRFVSEFADDLARLVAGELSQSAGEEKPGRSNSAEAAADDAEEKTEETGEAAPDLVKDAVDSEIYQAAAESAIEETETSQENSLADELKTQIDSGSLPEDVTKLVEKYLSSVQGEEAGSVRESVVTVWDFAGQHLYYASHPVFLSPRAIYVLVYNMSKELSALAEPCVRQGVHDILLDNANEETNLDNILSWLVSVHAMRTADRGGDSLGDTKARGSAGEELPYMRPPVIIVGSHADRPFQEPKRMETQIKRSLSGKMYEQHVLRPLYRVDNTKSGEDEGVKKVRDKINEVFELEPYMGEDVPVRWFNFEKVAEVLAQKKVFYLSVAKVQQLLRDVCYIADEAEVAALLDFYHDLGVTVWHGETVVLRAQWLIDLFRKLITVRPFDEQNPRHAEAWHELEESGLLSAQLIDHVFSSFLHGNQTKDDMLSMMETYGLIAKFTCGAPHLGGQLETKYFVPAQLCSSPQTLLDVRPSESDPCPLFVHFLDGFLPHGLFPQVVSRLIRCSPELGSRRVPNLFQNLARFIVGGSDEHDLILVCRKRFLKLILRRPQPRPASAARDVTAARARCCLETILSDLSRDYSSLRNVRYEICVACPSCTNGSQMCTTHRQRSCPREDCMHLLPVSRDGRMVCTRTFDERSRAEISGLEEWYREEVRESVEVPACSAPPDLVRPPGPSAGPAPAGPPPVFISYQWGIQGTAIKLRRLIEERGFRCWMDIGQMGGGDAMYAALDAGIRAAQVLIACVTEKYCVSENCQREVSLADNLRKPVVPLLFEKMPWPPAGQLSLILTKLLYVDMTQAGGDIPDEKFEDLVKRIEKYVDLDSLENPDRK